MTTKKELTDAGREFNPTLAPLRSQAGEDIVIAKAGAPIVRLIPYAPPRRKVAPPGSMEGEGWIAEDFDEPIDELFDCLKDHAE